MDRSRFWATLEPTYSLEDVPEFDPDAEITSPRSLEACEVEGVLVEELTYTPFEEFNLPGLEPTIVNMRHGFHEARRQDLLAVVRHRRQAMMLGTDPGGTLKLDPSSPTALGWSQGSISPTGSSPMGASMTPTSPKQSSAVAKARKEVVTLNRPLSPGLILPGEHNPMLTFISPGAPPSIPPFPNTYDFFSTWNKELAASGEAPKEGADGSQAGPAQTIDTGGAMMEPASPGSGSVEESSKKKANKGDRGQPPSPSSKKMEANEEYFLGQLESMRTCNGTDRVEYDFAKNTENHLVVLRRDQHNARGAAHHLDRHTTTCRNDKQEHTFERLLGDTLNNRASRDHREHFSNEGKEPMNLKAKARHQIVFENNATGMKDMVKKRMSYLEKHTEVHHARVARLANDAVNKKMACAQQTMEERLRWRACHHENVTLKGARYEAEKAQLFQKREEDFVKRQAVADNRGSLRQELYRLRHGNREMNDELRARKQGYELQKKKNDADQWKAGINAAAKRAARPKMRSNLDDSWSLSPASLEKSLSTPSLAMSRSVPTHMGSPLAASMREGSANRIFASWYRHG